VASLGLAGSALGQGPGMPPMGGPAPLPIQQGMPVVYTPQPMGQPMGDPGMGALGLGAPGMGAPPQCCPPPGAQQALDQFSLPNDGSGNGFNDDEPGCGAGIGLQVNVGGMGLMRQSLTSRPLAFLDPGINLGGTQIFADTGLLQPGPAILNTHDVNPDMQFGGRASVMWRECDYAFELCGFYIGQHDTTAGAAIPARINVGYAFFPTPIGFTPDNGLWAQADLVALRFQSSLANGEANFRFRTAKTFEWLVGVRYVDYQERFDIVTFDDVLVTGVLDPNTMARTSDRVHNRIVAPQLGFEWEQPLTSRIGIGATAKGAWGANFADYDHQLIRGDGFYGPGLHRSHTQFSMVYEAGLFADFVLFEQLKLRAGYQCLWLVDVPEATEQINFNLGAPGALFHENGSVFFHGPMLELQFVF
jgi:hypothetical protein